MPIKKRRRRLDKEESNIVIVGSGLAGLSAAISLEQAGFSNVSIFERDDSFDRQKEGYGLTLTYNPKGPLASLGLLEQVANEDCPSRSHYLFRQDGSIMGYFGNTFSKHRGLGQRGNLRIPRKVLRRLLLEKLSSSKVHWGHTLMDYVWDPETNQYTLHFEKKNVDGIEESQMLAVTADLLVAADGIRSAVLKKLQVMSLTPPSDNPRVGLRSIGIRLILGIAEFSHPLLNERGFYTLDGKHRLFTMPFESNRFDAAKSNRIMWQLSLLTNKEDADQDDKENYSGKPLDPTALREYVLDTCDQWHDPVKEMVNSTPLSTIWGTDLMDRDPRQVLKLIQDEQVRRLVVIGDALHSMSPFKGQGANQALKDGPLLAHWLQKASIDSAITSFWREIVQRAAPIVEASRKAAKELHSPDIMHHSNGFAGVQPESIAAFLGQLREESIGANSGLKLDAAVESVIEKSNVAAVEAKHRVGKEQQLQALQFAASGDLQGLRQLTLDKHSESIRVAKDSEFRNCLHLAAQGGHALTCKWLLTEVECDASLLDNAGKIPMDYAKGDSSTLRILQTV